MVCSEGLNTLFFIVVVKSHCSYCHRHCHVWYDDFTVERVERKRNVKDTVLVRLRGQ